MKATPISSDRRWTVTQEFTGKPKPQFVIRFCGEYVDSRATYPDAVLRAVGAKAIREGALCVTEIPAS